MVEMVEWGGGRCRKVFGIVAMLDVNTAW